MANSAATPSSSIQSMPVRIHDAWRLARICAPSHGKTIFSMPPVNFYASEPNTEGTIHFVEFDGTNWNAFDKGPAFRLPSPLHSQPYRPRRVCRYVTVKNGGHSISRKADLACSDSWEPSLKTFEQFTVERGTSDLQEEMNSPLPLRGPSKAEPVWPVAE
jgi:hypothetical protein